MTEPQLQLGKYLDLQTFCACTQTYQQYSDRINPYPQNPRETIPALRSLNQFILDPLIDYFGLEQFRLTYGFCSVELKRSLEQRNPITGIKNGRVDPKRDQHMAHERNRKGNYYCDRLGAACDFWIEGVPSQQVVEWILEQQLPFDSLYFYGSTRPIHISYGPQHKRDIWTFTPTGQPSRKGIEPWLELARRI